MKEMEKLFTGGTNRRSFLRKGTAAAGAATLGAALLPSGLHAFDDDEDGPSITKGDIAILKFLQALEQIEADLWQQYSELGGTQDNEVSGVNGGNPAYTQALQLLDGDMPQYIHDNTDDEISHATFLGNYLESQGAEPANLTKFKALQGSTAGGADKNAGRLTNLTQLTIDTSFWSIYRSVTNPDFDALAKFAQAVPSLNKGRHTAIPRSNDDTAGSNINLQDPTQSSFTDHLKAIAFTAGFHFAFIEQGGSSLYPTLAQHVTNLEVLRILLSIGPSETMHFQTWQDKAGNATPLTDFDKMNNSTVTFTDLKGAQGETNPESLNGDTLQANLIMPEPTQFLNKKFGPVAIVRPTSTRLNGATAAVRGFIDDGLFLGQKPLHKPELVQVLLALAKDADEARRRF